ncbi:MAG: exodeoxyribonuclease III [Dehalococcoidia bacterium]
MAEIKILSWNVNGIRAAKEKGFLELLKQRSPDILCPQETKAHLDQLKPDLLQPEGYITYWNYPERKGYSGVALFTREEPLRVQYDITEMEMDLEGRVIVADYVDFLLFNIYFPNGKKDSFRLQYKMAFYEAFLQYADSLKNQGRKLVICGDVNTAHKEIDLARPKENEMISGFLPLEREWIDKLVSHGYVDTFRYFNTEPGQYTWWDYKSKARERNVGWRIDYFFISENLLPALKDAFIMPEVIGSDHCPIGITLAL